MLKNYITKTIRFIKRHKRKLLFSVFSTFYIRRAILLGILPKNISQYIFIRKKSKKIDKFLPILSQESFEKASNDTIKNIFFEKNQNEKNEFNLEKVSFENDGQNLRGISIIPKNWKPSDGCILYTFGNNYCWQMSTNTEIISLAKRTNKKIYFFNDRNFLLNNSSFKKEEHVKKIAKSKLSNVINIAGNLINPLSNITTNTYTLVNDKVATADFIISKDNIKDNDLVLYGHSLGGFQSNAAAIKLHKKGKKVKVFTHNTGKSLSSTGRYLLLPFKYNGGFFYNSLNFFLEKTFKALSNLLFLEIDVTSGITKLYQEGFLQYSINHSSKIPGKSKFSNSFDNIIKYPAQIHSVLSKYKKEISAKISDKNFKYLVKNTKSSSEINAHCAPLSFSFCNNKNSITQEDRFVAFCEKEYTKKFKSFTDN